MNVFRSSRRLAIAFALIVIAFAMILVPVAEAAARHKPATTGSIAVTVELPKTVGPPLDIAIKAYRNRTLDSLGTCVLSKVLTNPDGSQYVVGMLSRLPLNTELIVSVTTPIPKGLLSQPGFAHIIMFNVAAEPMNTTGGPLILTAAAPTANIKFHPEDVEVVPPLPPATSTPHAASPLPASSTSPAAPSPASPAPSPSSS